MAIVPTVEMVKGTSKIVVNKDQQDQWEKFGYKVKGSVTGGGAEESPENEDIGVPDQAPAEKPNQKKK